MIIPEEGQCVAFKQISSWVMRALIGYSKHKLLFIAAASMLYFGCLAGQRYEVSWSKQSANGWRNPLGTGVELITSSAYDFDSPEYLQNHGARHAGIDLIAASGASVHAIGPGKVVKVVRSDDPMQLVIIVQHAGSRGSFFAIYGHVHPLPTINVGTDLKSGQLIGTIRQAGMPPHLHFGINVSQQITDFLRFCDGGKCGWGRTPKTVSPSSMGWVNPANYLATVTPGLQAFRSLTATILVMDVSGSMVWQWRGGVKIESAKKAALQFIEQVTNEPRPPGSSHMIGVVTFSSSASLACPLTENYGEAKRTVIQLGTLSSTNLGAGLVTALQELEKLPATARKFVILLSDGMTNTGLSRDQILSGPVVEARIKGICIHTVGFGDPGDIDDAFLRRIAAGSGCGSYSYASTGLELFGTYVKIRHRMLGSNRIVEFTSQTQKDSRVWVMSGQSISLGAFQLTAPAEELHYTLAWAENGRMVAKLIDPSGRQVTASYPGAQIYSGQGFSHITVFSPKTGIWKAVAQVLSVFPQGVQYYGVVSARTGGIVIPYEAPRICLFDDFCLPLPDLPTWLLVGLSVAVLAILWYHQLTGGL